MWLVFSGKTTEQVSDNQNDWNTIRISKVFQIINEERMNQNEWTNHW